MLNGTTEESINRLRSVTAIFVADIEFTAEELQRVIACTGNSGYQRHLDQYFEAPERSTIHVSLTPGEIEDILLSSHDTVMLQELQKELGVILAELRTKEAHNVPLMQ